MYGTQIDDIFENLVGSLGAWQIFIVFLVALSFPNNVMLSVFFNSSPNHRCRGESSLESWFDQEPKSKWNFSSIAHFLGPVDNTNGHTRQCKRYTGNVPEDGKSISDIFRAYDTARVVGSANFSCPNGYVYQYNSFQYKGGIVKEWDLVCDKTWVVPFSESAYMAGMLIGFIVGGWFSDRVGRRKTLLLTGIGEFCACFAAAFSPNPWCFIASRIVIAAFGTARGSAYVVLSAEITTAKYRAIIAAVGIILQIVVQGSMLGLLAYFVDDWRTIQLSNAAPITLVLLHIWLIPESPRWLAACGKAEKAADALYYAYRFNYRFRRVFLSKKMPPYMLLEDFLTYVGLGPKGRQDLLIRNTRLREYYSSNDSGKEFTIWRLFNPKLIKTTILSILILTCQITCIFGMMFYASHIKQHVSLVTVLNSLAQIPGCLLSAVLYRYCHSRKLPLMCVYAITVVMGALAASHTIYFKPTTDLLLIVFSNIIILLLSSTQRMLFVYVPELYKPIDRNRGFGLAAGMARLGALWFPLVNRLDQKVMHGLPLVIYTVILAFQLFLLLFFENTTGEARPSILVPEPPNAAPAESTQQMSLPPQHQLLWHTTTTTASFKDAGARIQSSKSL